MFNMNRRYNQPVVGMGLKGPMERTVATHIDMGTDTSC